MAQSPLPGIRAASKLPDSLAVVRQFVSNARPLLDSLTALHFARRRIATLEGRIAQVTQERDALASMATTAKDDEVTGQLQLAEANAEAARWRKRFRSANGERWLLRLWLSYSLPKQLGLTIRF